MRPPVTIAAYKNNVKRDENKEEGKIKRSRKEKY